MKTPNLTLLSLVILLLFSACKKDPVDYTGYFAGIAGGKTGTTTGPGGTTGGTGTPTPGGSGGTTITSDYYFKGTLDGVALNWQVTETSDWAAGTSAHGSIGETIDYAFAGAISNVKDYKNVQPAMTIFFKTFHFTDYETRKSVFSNFVNTGTWAYAPSDYLTVGKKDVYVEYRDNKGVDYNSFGDQTGSTFNVVSITKIPAELGISERIKLKLNLGCKLYPASGTGAALTLTNAETIIYLQDN